MPQMHIALELYTVRDETARDFSGTLHRVAEIGYPAVEFAGYGDLSTEQMANLLSETGLKAAATHVGLEALERDLEKEIEYCQAIGCSYLVLPWLKPEQRGEASLRALMPRLDDFGRRCHDHGITFGYHNHDFEFATIDGRRVLDILLDSTNPSLVGLEFDVYWAAFAGVDPASYLRARPARIPIIHLKDMGADRSFTEVGDGTLDMPGICRAALESGTHWFIVEHDAPRLPSLDSARRSFENLKQIQEQL